MGNINTEILSKTNGVGSENKERIKGAEYRLEKITRDLGERIGWSVKGSRQYIQDNPVKGVALAATAGIVAGSLLTILLRRRLQQA